MAIFTAGGGVAAVSGSVGGVTFSRNRGGPYMRTRAIPTDPGTTYQQDIRATVASLTSHWLNTLTPAQRAAWDTYALNVELPNSLGQYRNVGGIAMYIRSNVPRLQLDPDSLPRVDAAPTVFNLGEFTNPSMGGASEATQAVNIGFDNTDAWANEDDAAMLMHGSRSHNQSVNFFKGPYRNAGRVLGDAVTAPTSPEVVTWPFPFLEDQRIWCQIRFSRADGRLSAPFRAFTLCVA